MTAGTLIRKPYIIRTKLTNGGNKIFKYFFFPNYVKSIFDSYDIVLGNGFSPGYAYIAKRSLKMFIPYSMAGEFLYKKKIKNPISRIKYEFLRILQIRGLQKYTETIISLLTQTNTIYISLKNIRFTLPN